MRSVVELSPQINAIICARNPLINIPIIVRQQNIPILDLKFKISLLLSIIIIPFN